MTHRTNIKPGNVKLNQSNSVVQRFGAALQYRDYRFLWMSSLSAGAAAWALIVARAWLVYELTDSSVWVGVTVFAAMSPMFVIPPFAGFLADKMDRRKFMAALFVVQLIHNLILVALALTDNILVWHLVALSLVNGIARAGQMPASQALLPNLVPKKDLLNAISLNAATLHGSRLVGPGLIAPLMVTMGVEGAFIFCTLFYALALIFILRIRTVSVGQMASDKGITENFLAGLTFVYTHSLILPLVVVVFLHCCLTMAFESLLPVLAEDIFSSGGAGVSYLMMGVGAGALVSAVILAGVQSQKTRGLLLLGFALASGLGPIGLALASGIWVALLSVAVMGASQSGFMTITAAVIQSVVPDAIRGRVMSVYLWHIGGMMAIVNLVNAALADSLGAPLLLMIGGGLFTVAAIASLLKRGLKDLYLTGRVAYTS